LDQRLFPGGWLLSAPIHLQRILSLSNYRTGQVEDTLFSVPRCEFEQSSEVFADMFLLPSGPSASIEGQVKEHPIILEGYKKDDFACLLKVMYPTYVLSLLMLLLYCGLPWGVYRARSLISGSKIDLVLTKEEWVSVLKLSTIWNMKKVG